MTRIWRDHSLTIVLAGVAVVFLLACVPVEPGKWCDFLMGFGHSTAGVATLNFLSGPLRERNRPET
jgi:hypothetical protein